MGAVLSVPITMGTAVATSAATSVFSCFGSLLCTSLFSGFGACSSSIATRVSYAVLFSINSILSWIMLTDWAIKRLEGLTFNYMKFKCQGEECYGFVAVHRINFALGLFHLLLALLLSGVHSTRNPRAKIQNQFWGPKIVVWLMFIISSFFIPEKFFVLWGNYVAIAASIVFILIGLVLLVDFAHEWAETCLTHIEDDDSRSWRTILVGSTLSMYVGCLVLTILMYIFFSGSGCSMNQASITINLVLVLLVSIISVNPLVQEYNPKSGLAQAAMVCIYCSYLTMSAVASEPDDKYCNPLIRSRGTRTASIILGSLFTFIAIAYTTIRAATKTSKYDDSPSYNHVSSDELVVVNGPTSRSEMRANAIRAAIESGSLPATALNDDWDEYYDDEDREASSYIDDEKGSTKYNYSLFHLVFFLATQWTATLLTMNVEKDELGDFAPVGRTYFYSWVKIVSAWVCYALYSWTLVAPVLFPDRFYLEE
ncbi:TMS membrane protein/tumor differentially expressed protein [Nadsonia fulvescens var. elongata DSM 6958]|uniref:TMS membrane protein/tumor differentially expressed protein n=1 Tax=Nadsonia fulvescens var. elongata DSM 6958 TaxID=857566 RepID=A0A1E3PLU5_9ASCO|nr:TMS membrane protein/tumor differentially expressed protein [Nadsonia fulvescens var. elongata DSM 6958]